MGSHSVTCHPAEVTFPFTCTEHIGWAKKTGPQTRGHNSVKWIFKVRTLRVLLHYLVYMGNFVYETSNRGLAQALHSFISMLFMFSYDTTRYEMLF